jgi:two-component system KDP operon response regulator KdpE
MESVAARILLIEDDPAIRRFLRVSLVNQGYELEEVETGRGGIQQAASRPPDVIILDLGLPDMDGMDVIREVRQWSSLPIIVLTARGQESEKVVALDAGADDYLTKPFGVGELLARVRAVLRRGSARSAGAEQAVFEVEGLRADLAHRRVFMHGQEIHLTPTEYRMLTTLIRHAGKVLTHRQLLREVWGPQASEETHYLRVYMGQLRQKLGDDAARPRYLLTEPGVGYRLAAE